MNSNRRDYGATSSTTMNINISSNNNSNTMQHQSSSTIPDVNFSGFSPTEFMSLSENIAHNINSVKSSWQQLEKALKVIGTNRDTQATRDKIHHIQAQTNLKIQTTSKDLQRLTVLIRYGDKKQKLQIEKLTSDFKMIVEKYSQSQQQIAMKMKQIFLQSIHAQQQDDELQQQQQQQQEFNNMTALEREELMQRQKQIQNTLQLEQDLILDREQRIKEIEADVLDVNQIMKELSSLVHEQGEQIGKN